MYIAGTSATSVTLVNITASSLLGNTATGTASDGLGGGTYIAGGVSTLADTSFTENLAESFGGGLAYEYSCFNSTSSLLGMAAAIPAGCMLQCFSCMACIPGASCPALPCRALPSPAMPSPALPCPGLAQPCTALPCSLLPWLSQPASMPSLFGKTLVPAVMHWLQCPSAAPSSAQGFGAAILPHVCTYQIPGQPITILDRSLN